MCKWSMKFEKADAFPFFQHTNLTNCPLSIKEILYESWDVRSGQERLS